MADERDEARRPDRGRQLAVTTAASLGPLAAYLAVTEPRLLPLVGVAAWAGAEMAAELRRAHQVELDREDSIAHVAHELRTPLTPIRGYLQTLQRRDAQTSPAERQEVYATLLREEQHLEALVDRLLAGATGVHRSRKPARSVLAWPMIVREQVDLYARTDPARTVTVDLDPRAEAVVADATLAIAVLANLLSNALRHSPAGSPIAVATSLDGDVVVTTVSNDRSPVPAGDRVRIFDPYTQLAPPADSSGGVGLGLHIARQAVLAMDGEIWCDDAPTGGARFGFRLPAHHPTTRRADPSPSGVGA